MSTVPDLRVTLEPVLAALGLVVEDVTVSAAGKRRVVRVLVDSDIRDLPAADTSSPVEPLSLDAVAEATRAVSDALEPDEVMGTAPYVLEVSSPGVGRRLTTREQLRRQVGRLVELVHSGGTVTGRLVEVAADEIVVVVPATKKQPEARMEVALAEVTHAVVQVEFRRADAPTAADNAVDEHEDDEQDDDVLDDDVLDDGELDDDELDDGTDPDGDDLAAGEAVTHRDDKAGPAGSATEGTP